MSQSIIDLTGKKFGRLMVIKRSYPIRECGEARWLCKCDCGTEKIVVGGSLRSGRSKSCGCLKIELTRNRRRLSPGLHSMRQLMGSYKGNAKNKGLDFDLTEEQFFEITQQDCYYCGEVPSNISKGVNGNYIYNGLDRADNTKGYILSNVVPCCTICNYAKHKLTTHEFKDWIRRVYKKMLEKEI